MFRLPLLIWLSLFRLGKAAIMSRTEAMQIDLETCKEERKAAEEALMIFQYPTQNDNKCSNFVGAKTETSNQIELEAKQRINELQGELSKALIRNEVLEERFSKTNCAPTPTPTDYPSSSPSPAPAPVGPLTSCASETAATDPEINILSSDDCPITLNSTYDNQLFILDSDLICGGGDAITLTGNDSLLDCQDFLIQQTPSTDNNNGIVVSGNNDIVRNCRVANFSSGIRAAVSSNAYFQNVHSFGNFVGALILSSTFLTVSDSSFDNNRGGMRHN